MIQHGYKNNSLKPSGEMSILILPENRRSHVVLTMQHGADTSQQQVQVYVHTSTVKTEQGSWFSWFKRPVTTESAQQLQGHSRWET